MSHFQILEDVENGKKVHNSKIKKVADVGRNNFVGKKNNTANRGVLQPVNNGIRQEAKRARLSVELEDINEEKSLDDSLKENKEIQKINDEILKIEKPDIEPVENIEESRELLPKPLLYCTEYKKEIWTYLHELEKSYSVPRAKYMLKQADLSWNTRSILIDWLSSVAEEYKLCKETFHLSVNYIDRFLNHIAVVRNKFQLVGAAAMLLAGKMEEIYPIDVKEWSYLTGDTFTARQILKMEQLIVKVLKFKMQPPTICTFIENFSNEHNLDSKTMNLAMYISELVLLEGEEYLNYVPSKLAAASIALARYTLSKDRPWPKKFKETSGYSLKQLSPVVQRQHITFRESPLKDQQAIQSKYKSDKYHRVALLKPRNLVLDDFEEDE